MSAHYILGEPVQRCRTCDRLSVPAGFVTFLVRWVDPSDAARRLRALADELERKSAAAGEEGR